MEKYHLMHSSERHFYQHIFSVPTSGGSHNHYCRPHFTPSLSVHPLLENVWSCHCCLQTTYFGQSLAELFEGLSFRTISRVNKEILKCDSNQELLKNKPSGTPWELWNMKQRCLSNRVSKFQSKIFFFIQKCYSFIICCTLFKFREGCCHLWLSLM